MKIKNDLVVAIHFAVAEVDGNSLDNTANGAPLEYIQGSGYLVPGLEAELEGKEVGDKFDIKLDADQAYGEYQESLVQSVPRSLFEGVDEIVVGMSFEAETEQGPCTVEVTEVNDENISIDANHPLAGMSLQFVGQVVGIRAATEEELEQGYVEQQVSSNAGGCGSQCCGGDTSKHSHGDSCCGGHQQAKASSGCGCGSGGCC